MEPPFAKRIPHSVLLGKLPKVDDSSEELLRGKSVEKLMDPPIVVEDDLFWLRDDSRSNKEVLDHLQAENIYLEENLNKFGLNQSINSVYDEILSRIKESDSEIPYKCGTYLYYTRTEENRSYPIHCRRKDAISSESSSEEIVLDENEVADGHEMCDIHQVKISESETHVAYSVDFSGNEEFTIKFKSLNLSMENNTVAFVDEIVGTNGSVEWTNDDLGVFYLTLDEQHRPCRAWLHIMGTSQSEDVLLYEELDSLSWVHLMKSASKDFIFLRSTTKTSSEVVAIPLSPRALSIAHASSVEPVQKKARSSSNESLSPVRLIMVQPRVPNLLYEVEHFRFSSHSKATSDGLEDLFVILTNADNAINFKVVITSVLQPAMVHWRDAVAHSLDFYIESISVFQDFWSMSGREEGYENVMLVTLTEESKMIDLGAICRDEAVSTLKTVRIPPCDEVYMLSEGRNEEYVTDRFRFTYESPTTPTLICEYRFNVGDETWGDSELSGIRYESLVSHKSAIVVLKRKEVPNVDLSKYRTARLKAPTSDGKFVPISLLYRVDKHELRDNASFSDLGYSDRCLFKSPASLLLYGYGAYGISWDPVFSVGNLSICDRGVVYAIAHVRGGSELGRSWYESGKMMSKMNTFLDFIAVADHLIAAEWTASGRIVAQGGSAGGLTVAVALNMRPELFCGVLAGVPFVDAVVTMCDSTIPLVSTGMPS